MSAKEKFLTPFREVTGVLKDIGWWLGGTVAFVALARPYWNTTAANIALHVGSGLFLIYATIRALVYRRRNRRFYAALKYVHATIHDIRNILGKELQYLRNIDEFPDLPEEVLTDASIKSLHEVLQGILDAASSCFRELTGYPCTAVLIMPEHSKEDGDHLKARLYSCNAPNERIKAAKPHKAGLVVQAFKSTSVICGSDLREEMKKGNFVKRDGEETFKWYSSTMLCHFKVCGEPWGVLAIDSPQPKNFRPYYGELICAFADACGLAFVLSEHGDLGNYVYQTTKN